MVPCPGTLSHSDLVIVVLLCAKASCSPAPGIYSPATLGCERPGSVVTVPSAFAHTGSPTRSALPFSPLPPRSTPQSPAPASPSALFTVHPTPLLACSPSPCPSQNHRSCPAAPVPLLLEVRHIDCSPWTEHVCPSSSVCVCQAHGACLTYSRCCRHHRQTSRKWTPSVISES